MKYPDTSEQDLEKLKQWIDADPAHKDVMSPEFWIRPVGEDGQPETGVKCLRVEDDNGTVFFLRLENALRVYIQFPPDEEVSKMRTASALRRMIWFIGGGAKKAGYHEAIFDSKSEKLISFLKKLNIDKVENTYQIKL